MLFGKFHILHDLYGAEILSLFIPHRQISDKEGPPVLLHPDGNAVPLAITKIVYDSADHGLDLRQVAGEHLPVNCHAGALEHLGALVELAVIVVRVHKGDLRRDGIQKGCELLDGHVPAGHDDLGSLYVPKLLRKIRPDTLQGFTRAQTAYIRLELFRARSGSLLRRIGNRHFRRFTLCLRWHLARQGKAMLHQDHNHLIHGDVFHFRSPQNGHQLSYRVQHSGLFDFRKAQLYHNILKLRVLRNQLVDRAAHINCFAHRSVPLIKFCVYHTAFFSKSRLSPQRKFSFTQEKRNFDAVSLDTVIRG